MRVKKYSEFINEAIDVTASSAHRYLQLIKRALGSRTFDIEGHGDTAVIIFDDIQLLAKAKRDDIQSIVMYSLDDGDSWVDMPSSVKTAKDFADFRLLQSLFDRERSPLNTQQATRKVAEIKTMEDYGIIELRDGVTLDSLMDVAPWLFKGDVEMSQAIIGYDKRSRGIKWYGGIWENGTWEDGEWISGEWFSGTWKRGRWENGYWEGGTWEDGVWNFGIWKKGTWKDGTWEGGKWYGDTWEDGTWEDGLWYDGEWMNGTWEGGRWIDGTWYKGTWKGGTWEDGRWENGVWEGGTWYSGTWKDGLWYDGEWMNGTWENGTWKYGEWNSTDVHPNER